MNKNIRNKVLSLSLTAVAIVLGMGVFSAASAQNGNRISGYVFGYERRPVADLFVELQDDYYRTIGRTRTTSSGYYTFSGLSSGNFVVRVFTFGTDFEEQEARIEIINLGTTTSNGSTRATAFDSQQKDFYLKFKRGVSPGTTAALYVQDVPEAAKKLYDKAIDDLNNKREPEGLAGLRSALEIFPKYYAALEKLATKYTEMNRPEGFQAAEILFSIAVGVNERGFRSWYGLAYARYSLAKYDAAIPDIKKAVEINANFPEAVCLYGVLLRQTKKYDEAEKQLLKAIELSKDQIPQAHWELALIYGNHMKKYTEAANELKAFLKAQPNTKDADSIKRLIADFEAKALSK